MRTLTIALSAASLASLTMIAATGAEAGKQRAAPPQPQGGAYVIAESQYGHGTVTGAVRETNLGPQVQLPSGHWEYCRRSCSETLRVQSIDFDGNNRDEVYFGGKGTIGNECGIFGCISIGLGRRGFGY